MGLLSNRTVRSSLKPGDSDGDYGLRFNTPLPLSLSKPPIRTNGASNGAQPEIDASRKRKLTVLPLEVGTRVNCRWRDGKYHPVKVIERRKLSCDGVNDYEYYVHYTEFNRRLDEWVKLDQLDLSSVELETWYFSPFPPEYNDCTKLFFCEFCLNFMKCKEQLQRHMRKCDLKHPPGDEIYRNGTLSMFEANVRENVYHGIMKLVLVDPPSAGTIFDLLLSHFQRFYREVFIYRI